MIEKLKKISVENYFFFLVTFLNLIPVAQITFFPTMDGPAHLYNSTIINELLFSGNSQLSDFFTLNTTPVPNWTGHFILSFFNLFLPGYVTEKIVILFFLIGLPLSFRYLTQALNPESVLLSYLIFPFTYSFLFLLGFYNFSLGLVFFFLAMGFWIRYKDKPHTKSALFILALLITLTYFSHVFVFGVLLFVIAMHTIFTILFSNLDKPGFLFSEIIRQLKTLVIVSVIPLALFLYYIYSAHSNATNLTFIDPKILIEWIKNIRPIVVYNTLEEEVFTKKIFYVLIMLMVIVVYDRVNVLTNNEKSLSDKLFSVIKYFFRLTDFWLFAAIAMLVLYFKLPDSEGSAGYISVRLGLLFFLLFTVWLCAQKIPKWFGFIAIMIVLYCNFRLNNYYRTVLNDLNKIALSCNVAGEKITARSIVLPLNFSDNWLVGHFSNYLGADKPMVILENYECSTGYFPVKWNTDAMPKTKMGSLASGQLPCFYWQSNSSNSEKMIDFIFMLGSIESRTDSCTLQFKNELERSYTLVHDKDNCKLYQRKL